MNRLLTWQDCEPAAGRRTLANRLADHWSQQGKSVLVLTIGDERGTTIDPVFLLERFQTLPPLLLRNFLSDPARGAAHRTLSGFPEPAVLKSLLMLLRSVFDWTFVLLPQQNFSEMEITVLDQSELMLWVARPGKLSADSFQKAMETLNTLHFANAFSQVIFNRMPTGLAAQNGLPQIIPGKAALEKFPEDPIGLRLQEGIRRLAHSLETWGDPLVSSSHSTADQKPAEQIIEEIKTRVQPQLLRALEHQESSSSVLSEAAVAKKTLETCLAEESGIAVSREERNEIYTRVLEDVMGLGPIEPLLKDPSVSEVMVNGRGCVYVERKGKLQPTTVSFSSDTQLRTIIDRIVAPIGRRVDESMPLCDARLADGSRVNIVLPPLSLDGPVVTIRKFMTRALGFDDLVKLGSMDSAMAGFLRECVVGKRNMVVAGGTGSGKTTLLNALSSAIPDDERIVTIEDAAELRLQKPHVIRLESRPPNAEGEGAIPIRRLVINALRMRPDRIVVGECRGGEALDMLQAMNTGHDGSLTTVHANAPRDALGRLETLVLMAGIDLPVKVVREQIRSAVHLIVQQSRLPDGSRKVTSITEITGMEGNTLVTQELFRYKSQRFESTGIVPHFKREKPEERAA